MSSTKSTFQDKLVVFGIVTLMVLITVLTQKCEESDELAKASVNTNTDVMSEPEPQTAPVLITRTAPEPTYEERVAAEFEEISKDITSISTSEFRTSDDIMLYLNKLNAAAKRASQASNSLDVALAKTAIDLQETIKLRQLEVYPELRKKWVDLLLRDAMDAQDISVSIEGKRNTILTFTAGRSATMDKENLHFIYEDVYNKLRFKQANYKWGEHETFNVGSLNDADLAK